MLTPQLCTPRERRGESIFAVGAYCTHYHGPLADGLVVGATVRCPWHHACFDLRTGEALAAPPLCSIASGGAARRQDLGEREARKPPQPKWRAKTLGNVPERIVIVGGAAAGFAAAEVLRREPPFPAAPFFWSQHYDVPINYVGHAEKWHEIAIEGDIASKDCLLRFERNGRVLAVASIFRDLESLQGEVAMGRAPAAQRQCFNTPRAANQRHKRPAPCRKLRARWCADRRRSGR